MSVTTDPPALTPKAQRTRAALLDATRDIVGASGVSATNVMTICDRAGIGRTSFYNYFDDTRDAVAEVARDAGNSIKAAFDAVHAGQPRGLDRLQACLTMVLEIGADDPSLALLLTSLAQADTTLPDLLSAEVAAELAGAGLDHDRAETAARFVATATLALTRNIAEGRMSAARITTYVEMLMRASHA